ncbi:uncharacterized protein G2W53_009385 [Senna tora]|uniref:Uncharacterized protein n=1 Tax=Senna tora TaxID=362788 RepID=A0A835CA31_9FABA|nr:uncharacterized protein G2W53_009385 [Senna tora]
MSTKSPIFPLPEPQHFSDYGFDPQIDYFQVLEEAMKHKRETAASRPIDSVHFKLQKPISKDDSRNKVHHHHHHHKRKRWWKNALLFFKWRWAHRTHSSTRRRTSRTDHLLHRARARAFRASISGPVYLTESRSGSATPYRSTSRPSSGPLAKSEVMDIPYLSLRELTMEQHQLQQQRMSTSATPIYLVT